MKMTLMLVFVVVVASDAFANEAHNLLMQMSPHKRSQTLAHLLAASGKDCDQAIRSFFQGFDKDKAPYWNVECSKGTEYNIQIIDDNLGSTRILECSVMKALGIECFKKFK